MADKLYSRIASLMQARMNCEASGNTEWKLKHAERLEELVKRHMPSGSGFDSGTQFNWDESKPEKLVFNTAFHHMDEHGYYDGWSNHSVIVTASLAFGTNIRVTGRNRRDIKEYIREQFAHLADVDAPTI